MTIEIHQPELEALIEQQMASGRFQNVEDFLLTAIKSASMPEEATPGLLDKPKLTLVEVFALAREILDGEELDFSREPSYGRTVDLS